MKRNLATLVTLSILILAFATQVSAWFGAGRTPGWPHTTTGLAGEIAISAYKFAPDFYELGETVAITTTIVNESTISATQPYYFVVSRVIESPLGSNVEDGDPDAPGLNENQLHENQNSGNDLQQIVAVQYLGEFTFIPGQPISLSGSYPTDLTGYFQFDFMAIDPRAGYEPGNIASAGFFRVLDLGNQSDTPTPTPQPASTPSPTPADELNPTPTPTSTAQPTPTPSSSNPTPTPTNSPAVGGYSTNDTGNSNSTNTNTSNSDPRSQVLGYRTDALPNQLANTGYKNLAFNIIIGFFSLLAGLWLTTRQLIKHE